MSFKPRLTNSEKILLELTPRVKSIIIGLILSDAWLQKRGHWNTRIGFKQSIINFSYLWYIYNELGYLCSGLPMSAKTVTRGKIFYSVYLQTRQLTCLNEIFNLFYLTINDQIKKTVKQELFFYMDYMVLAHWIMATNNIQNNELHFYLKDFSISDKVRLINILIIKFNINCILKSKGNSHYICIPKKETKNLFLTLTPYLYDFYKCTNQKRAFQTSSSQFRLSNLERATIILPQNLKDILIGLILGDLYIQKLTKNGNPNLQFEQGLVNKDYMFHLYDLFKDYCNSEPKISERKPDPRTNKVYSRVRFHTYYLPCFNELYSLFYPEGKKVIPLNIGELLTPIGLAYWAMDDGNRDRNNFILNTNSYTLNEVELLSSVLKEKFNLDCTLQKHSKDKNQYRINIRTKSVPLFKELVLPYFHDSMIYKLN